MTKAVEAVVMFALLIFVFFAGVSYSDAVKSHAGWLFENNEEDSMLPDLVNGKGAVDEVTLQDDTSHGIEKNANDITN